MAKTIYCGESGGMMGGGMMIMMGSTGYGYGYFSFIYVLSIILLIGLIILVYLWIFKLWKNMKNESKKN